jgi:hypothetical protein
MLISSGIGSAKGNSKFAHENLKQWRDERIAWILQPSPGTPAGASLTREAVISKCGVVFDELQSVWGSEGGYVFDKNAESKTEMGHFVQFVTAQHWMGVKDAEGKRTHVLGSDLSDKAYLGLIQPYIQLPELLASQPFLLALENPSSYRSAVQMIDARNKTLDEDSKWPVVAYRSQFIRSVDQTTYGRLLVVVPNQRLIGGDRLEQWFQFAIATPDTKAMTIIQSLSVIARVTRPDGESHAFFVDLLRHRNPVTGEITFSSTYLLNPMPSSNCFNCHKTAVLPLHPKSLLEFGPKGVTEHPMLGDTVVADVNRRAMATIGREKLFVNPVDFGPNLGTGDPRVLDEKLRDAAVSAGLSPTSIAKVRQSATCSKCHGSFAPLNFDISVSTDRDSKSFESKRGLAQSYVEVGFMPPKNDLTPAERKALWKGLSGAYYDPHTVTGAFVDWLKGESP